MSVAQEALWVGWEASAGIRSRGHGHHVWTVC